MNDNYTALDDVEEIVIKINSLLKDKQPGLITWNIALAKKIDELAEYAPSFEKIKEKI